MLIGCASQRQGELKGEVFIVTKGGENIKLGLVEISVIPEAEINAAIAKKKPAMDSTLAQLKSDFDKASAEYNSVHQRYEQADQNYDRAQKEATTALLANPLSGGYEQAQKRAVSWSNERSKLFMPDSEARIKKDSAEWKAKGFPTAEFFFDGLPTGITKTMTNSNGEFSVTLPRKGKFAIAAHAHRETPEEKYYWLIWVSLDDQATKTIMLSNHNLMTSDSTDVVVRAKAMAF